MILGILYFLGVLGGEVFSISTDFDTLPEKGKWRLSWI